MSRGMPRRGSRNPRSAHWPPKVGGGARRMGRCPPRSTRVKCIGLEHHGMRSNVCLKRNRRPVFGISIHYCTSGGGVPRTSAAAWIWTSIRRRPHLQCMAHPIRPHCGPDIPANRRRAIHLLGRQHPCNDSAMCSIRRAGAASQGALNSADRSDVRLDLDTMVPIRQVPEPDGHINGGRHLRSPQSSLRSERASSTENPSPPTLQETAVLSNF